MSTGKSHRRVSVMIRNSPLSRNKNLTNMNNRLCFRVVWYVAPERCRVGRKRRHRVLHRIK
jgi:hypothetical protein